MHGVSGAEKPIQRLLPVGKGLVQTIRIDLPPDRRGVHLLIRQVDLAETDIFVGVVAYLLVSRHPPHQVHLTMSHLRPPFFRPFEVIQNLQSSVVDGIGVVVGTDLPDVGLASRPVQPLNLVGAGLDHVDGTLIEGHRCAAVIHFGDHLLPAASSIDHHEVALRHRTQGDRIGGVAVRHPVPTIGLPVQHALLLQIREEFLQCLAAKPVALLEREFESGTSHMVQQDQQLIGGDTGLFR